MKYPQLVSMPTSVQDWLDEQLEARGIDAVVYTRYVFSLLQHDTLDLTDFPHPGEVLPNKPKEIGHHGHGRKHGRQEGYWDLWNSEQLKRSAAVKCLMSAAEQKCGIEKLVDDLCAKLKEIERQDQSNLRLELSETEITRRQMPSQTLQDQAQKYYAAFPPLTNKIIEPTRNVEPLIAAALNSVWSSGSKVVANTAVEKAVSVMQQEHGIGWEENKENYKDGKNYTGGIQGNVTQPKEKLEPYKSVKEADYRSTWNMSSNMTESYDELSALEFEDSVSQGRLYLRQADSPGCHDGPPKRTLDDKNLALLIAKFDESIEALWSPDQVDKGSQPLTYIDCSQELPVDFQQLLSSPSDNIELCGADNKRGSAVNLFIPCGTNITSSIWSDCNEDSNMETGEEVGHTFAENCASYCRPVNNRMLQGSSISRDGVDMSGELHSNVVWNKSEILPSFFTNLPFGMSYALGDLTQNITNQKWSDVDSSSSVESWTTLDNSATGNSKFKNSTYWMSSLSSIFTDGRFVTLNHNKENSSFTEVIPKLGIDGQPTNLDLMVETLKTTLVYGEKSEFEQEDEDLLTSARTHFKPIKQESVNSQSCSIRGYADGTTFVIPNCLEVLPFKRSQSGMLYLVSETRLDTPTKYKEYKEKEPYGGRCLNSGDDDLKNETSKGSEFIPKFKVCPNEKFCQTEENVLKDIVTADCNKLEVKLDNDDNFFFPGDDQLADTMVACVHEVDDESDPDCYCFEQDTNIKAAKQIFKNSRMSQVWGKECCKCNNNNMSSWNAGVDVNKPLADIWSANSGTGSTLCQNCGPLAMDHKAPVWGLREELTEDGEQLLSDLSYMQHLFLGSDWLEDNTEQQMGDWIVEQDDDEEGNRPSAEKFQCISPMCTIGNDDEMVMYTDDKSCSRSLPGKHLARETVARFEAKSVDDFFSKCLLDVLPKTILLSVELEAKWKLNERPFNAKVNAKDRKRRHSASRVTMQEVSTSVTRAQTSCVNGITCPQFIFNHARAFRPVTL